MTLFKAGLDVIMAHEGDEREAYTRELKTILHRYLEPMIRDDTAARADSHHTP